MSSRLKLFKNLGEQLRAIYLASTTNRTADERLNRLNKEYQASHGMNEGVGADGGFVIQSDFAGAIIDSAAKAGDILPLVDQYQIGQGSNAAHWVEPDEDDVSDTVYGGIRLYWDNEAAQINASQPTLRERKLKLHRLSGLVYATYELDSDSIFISDLYTRAFTLGIMRKLEEAIISGNGIDRPLAMKNGNGAIEIPKESGQAAGTVVWNNITKMYNQALNKDSTGRYVWLAHPDVTEQFDELTIPVGTGGTLAYHPANQQGPTAFLKGRPIIESEFCSALGSAGDIQFVDLHQYMLILKDGVHADKSIHVQFQTAENCFRFIFRANGMPKRSKSVTIKNSNKKRSSYIILGERS